MPKFNSNILEEDDFIPGLPGDPSLVDAVCDDIHGCVGLPANEVPFEDEEEETPEEPLDFFSEEEQGEPASCEDESFEDSLFEDLNLQGVVDPDLSPEERKAQEEAIAFLTRQPQEEEGFHPDFRWSGVPSASVYMPFGKHREEIPWDIDPDYLAWASRTIPLEFYSFYLPRFTQEAGKDWIGFWEGIYGGTLHEEVKKSRMNLRPNGNDQDDITLQIAEKIKGTQRTNSEPLELKEVKKRRNVFQIHGKTPEVVSTILALNGEKTPGVYQEAVLLCATQGPSQICAEILLRRYKPSRE